MEPFDWSRFDAGQAEVEDQLAESNLASLKLEQGIGALRQQQNALHRGMAHLPLAELRSRLAQELERKRQVLQSQHDALKGQQREIQSLEAEIRRASRRTAWAMRFRRLRFWERFKRSKRNDQG